MIRYLQGTLLLRDDPHIIINVNGVGYNVLVSQDVLRVASTIGDQVQVFVYTHVREDILELYGFPSYEDLKLFEQFIGVSGIGPKTAVGIFSIGSRSEILRALTSSDATFFTRVPRLGKKNAQKLIIELRSKFAQGGESILSADDTETDEVVSALRTFGFSQDEARAALSRIGQLEGKTTEDKIRLSLKYLAK